VGTERPPFAREPGPGQESVWDYPRPPRIEASPREVVVRAGGVEIARTRRALRVLETASPPTYYLPPDDLLAGALVAAPGGSRCEWKGTAAYWSVVAGGVLLEAAAWSYPEPLPGFEAVAGYVSFYPALVSCTLDGIAVTPQPGSFYGGWVTPDLAGPFKGEAGSGGW
jgi:uncharacterized protein (DUF427 family)